MCWYAPIVSLWWVFPYKDADPITKHQNNLNMSFLNCHYSHRNAVILFAAVAHSSITTGRIYRRQNKRKHNRAISRFSVEQKALQLIKPLSNSSLVIFKLMTMCCQWRKYSEKVFHWELKVAVHVILIIQYNIIHLFNIQSVQRCCSPPCQACCCPSQCQFISWATLTAGDVSGLDTVHRMGVCRADCPSTHTEIGKIIDAVHTYNILCCTVCQPAPLVQIWAQSYSLYAWIKW